jgi:hypothetical protein
MAAELLKSIALKNQYPSRTNADQTDYDFSSNTWTTALNVSSFSTSQLFFRFKSSKTREIRRHTSNYVTSASTKSILVIPTIKKIEILQAKMQMSKNAVTNR